jgi:acyl dehydratase
MADQVTFNADALGVWADESKFAVTRERLIQYAEATNDPIARHREGEVATPVFAIVPVFPSLMEPALQIVPLSLFGRILHGEQDFVFHRPIRPGDQLTSRGRVLGFEGLPNGTRCNVHLECRDEDGELVNEQYVTFFVRGADAGEQAGTLAPDHRFDEALRGTDPVASVTQHIDEDQTFRYSEASGDPMPIHLDDEFARNAGLPGIIAHGLCTMAFTSWAVLTEVADGEVERLRRLAVRFSKPVLPGQDIVTSIWRDQTEDGVTTYRYETRCGDDVVIKDGLAEIAD